MGSKAAWLTQGDADSEPKKEREEVVKGAATDAKGQGIITECTLDTDCNDVVISFTALTSFDGTSCKQEAECLGSMAGVPP